MGTVILRLANIHFFQATSILEKARYWEVLIVAANYLGLRISPLIGLIFKDFLLLFF